MRPAVGLSCPVSSLKSVLLPAPLGPIRQRSSRSASVKSTPRTASTPPKRIDSPMVCSTAPLMPGCGRARGPRLGRGAGGAKARCRAPRARPQPGMSGAVLQTIGLSIRFGGVEAVRGVDFTLAERELRCLIGPNGAGKSTLFKLLTGQLKPTAGRILFQGHDITGHHTHAIARRGIGIKTQVPSLFDSLTVREHLWLAARRTNPTERTRAVADEILERIGLTSLASGAVGQLSHGLRQWVELGTVLAGNPELILLDEPAAGMTHDEVARTAELVREINRTHALIVVEHDMQFVRMIARTVTVMHQGAVLVEDTMDQILKNATVRDVYLGKHGGS